MLMRKIVISFLILLLTDSVSSQSRIGFNYFQGATGKSADYNGRLTESRVLRYPALGTATFKTSFLYVVSLAYRYRFQKWQAEAGVTYQQNNIQTDITNFDRSILLRVNTIHPSVAIIRDLLGNKKIVLSAKLGLNTGFTIAKRTSIFEKEKINSS